MTTGPDGGAGTSAGSSSDNGTGNGNGSDTDPATDTDAHTHTDPGTDTEHSKLLVRGLVSAEYHADVYEHEEELLRKSSGGLDCQCLGGGRILHEPERKYIKVYGYSVGYGKADHTKSVELLKKHYPSYEIEWSDDGY